MKKNPFSFSLSLAGPCAGGEEAVLQDDVRMFIKERIVDMMVSLPEKIQNQLSDAIAIIGKYDFPHAWESLMVCSGFVTTLLLCID